MNKTIQYRLIEKSAYIRSAENISVPKETLRGAMFTGAAFTPYGIMGAGNVATKGLRAKRKAFAIPVAIGAGLGGLTKGLLAKSDKDLIRAQGRPALKDVNIRHKEDVAAARGGTKGLATGMALGAGLGGSVGKLLGSLKRFKKFKGVGGVGGAIIGGSLAGLAGHAIGEHRGRRKYQLENVWNY